MLVSSAFAAELSAYSGAALFKRLCASCHGPDGLGHGPVAPFFRLTPPDLTRIAQQNGGVFPAERVRETIDGRREIAPHGTRNMPVWGVELISANDKPVDAEQRTQRLIVRLVEHLRAIQAH